MSDEILTKHQREDERAWREKYARELDGPNTVQCACGEQILGDSPAIEIECFLCFRKARHGIK
jgi:hypothetical protein